MENTKINEMTAEYNRHLKVNCRDFFDLLLF